MLIREDNNIVSEDDQRIAQLTGAALTVLEAFISEDVGLRPESQEGFAAKLGENAF
jgi:hypothetical protein